MNPITITQEQRKSKAEREAREQQEQEDFAAVLDTVEGKRVMTTILDGTGIGRSLPATEIAMQGRNYGLQLLDVMKRAHPKAAMEIIANLYGMGEYNG